jgi:hypothetical protein
MGFINSFDTKVYHTIINHFDLRGSLATLVRTSISTTMTISTTPREMEDLVMSTGQEGLGEHIRGPATSKREVFLPSAYEMTLKMMTSVDGG